MVAEAQGGTGMTRASGREKRGLVVEDEPTIAKVCVRVLGAEGFEVDVAVDGESAQDRLRRNMYDLCLIDIRMPKMGGIELYQQLKVDCPEMTNRVIFTTGDVINDNVKAFLKETGRPFLPKPFAPNELRSVVRAALALSSRNGSGIQ
jgi:CheY-like chemotaxis protein